MYSFFGCSVSFWGRAIFAEGCYRVGVCLIAPHTPDAWRLEIWRVVRPGLGNLKL